MRDQLQQALLNASRWVRQGKDWPQWLVRVGVRSAEIYKIVHSAREDGPPWSPNLVERVIDVLFETQGVDISVFATTSRDRFDKEHALGVLAGTIAVQGFDSKSREKYRAKLAGPNAGKTKAEPKDDFGRKVVAFILNSTVLKPGSLKRTPLSNMNFAPADYLHHDARPVDVGVCAKLFLDGLRDGAVRYTFLREPEFRVQAALALSAAIDQFGDLSEGSPPSTWRDGETLDATEQLTRLRTIAGDVGIQTRLEFHRSGSGS